MKRFIGVVSVLLCLTLVSGGIFSGTSAVTAESVICADPVDLDAAVLMAPGSDETQRNFSWYSPAYEGNCYVLVSTQPDLSGAKKFEGTCIETPEEDLSNKVTVTGLEADTTYYYACYAGEKVTETYSFKTASEDGFSAVYMTDIHVSEDETSPLAVAQQGEKFDETLEAALEKNDDISLILSAGDQASSGLRSEYTWLMSGDVTKTMSFATAIGNHDKKGIAYKYFKNNPNEDNDFMLAGYNGSDYWFVEDNVLFLVMDSNNSCMGEHKEFMEDAIEKNPGVKWRVMMFHHDLYGGRIERREQENSLLRAIWTPLADAYQIDLVLLGHSHYYTVSNVVYGNETVNDISGVDKVTDANGTIYMVSGSINRPRSDDATEEIPLGENIADSYITQDRIYNILDFTDDTITVSSYTVESGEMFNSFTLEKTDNDGGHPDEGLPFYYPILSVLGTIVQFFNGTGDIFDYINLNYIPFLD